MANTVTWAMPQELVRLTGAGACSPPKLSLWEEEVDEFPASLALSLPVCLLGV